MANLNAVSDIPFVYSPGENDEPSHTVVESVAWTKGVQPDQLNPLQEVIDMDTLNDLFAGMTDLELSFRYAGCRVVVEQGQVWVDRD